MITAIIGIAIATVVLGLSDNKEYTPIIEFKPEQAKRDTRAEERKNLYRKLDNMTVEEMDYYMKFNNLYEDYGEYSKEARINKILDRLT